MCFCACKRAVSNVVVVLVFLACSFIVHWRDGVYKSVSQIYGCVSLRNFRKCENSLTIFVWVSRNQLFETLRNLWNKSTFSFNALNPSSNAHTHTHLCDIDSDHISFHFKRLLFRAKQTSQQRKRSRKKQPKKKENNVNAADYTNMLKRDWMSVRASMCVSNTLWLCARVYVCITYRWRQKYRNTPRNRRIECLSWVWVTDWLNE